MEFTYLMEGFAQSLTLSNLFICFVGAFLGTIIGLLPGIGPVNGVAMLLPIAYSMKLPVDASLILLASVYMGAEYGGRISAILMNIPGDAGAIMTTVDGYPLTQKGKAGVALSLSAFSSFIGNLIAFFLFIFLAPLFSRFALMFGPAEYFLFMLLAFIMLVTLVDGEPLKTAFCIILGLALGTVGIDSTTGVYRFTFDLLFLSHGIDFITLVIGVFSFAEILFVLDHFVVTTVGNTQYGRMLFNTKELLFSGVTIIRSGLVGFVVGVLPGAGATIASAVAYSVTKKVHESPTSEFGKGDLRGVAAPESANSAAAFGSFVPMLTLGIPGSGTTAVMMGALTLYNVNPGPTLFTDNPLLVWGFVASLFVTNLMLLVLNIPLVKVFVLILRTPYWTLFPLILAISVVGIYAINSGVEDLYMMLILGLLGYILKKLNFSLSPLVLGFVLSDMIEQNLRRAFSISGDASILYQSMLSKILIVAIILVVFSFMKRVFKGNKSILTKI